jgi:hypothetical protein
MKKGNFSFDKKKFEYECEEKKNQINCFISSPSFMSGLHIELKKDYSDIGNVKKFSIDMCNKEYKKKSDVNACVKERTEDYEYFALHKKIHTASPYLYQNANKIFNYHIMKDKNIQWNTIIDLEGKISVENKTHEGHKKKKLTKI